MNSTGWTNVRNQPQAKKKVEEEHKAQSKKEQKAQPKKKYYHVQQGYGRLFHTDTLKDGISGIGTDYCGPCLGFYVQLDEHIAYVAHVDTDQTSTKQTLTAAKAAAKEKLQGIIKSLNLEGNRDFMRSTMFGVGAISDQVALSIYDGIYEAVGGTAEEKYKSFQTSLCNAYNAFGGEMTPKMLGTMSPSGFVIPIPEKKPHITCTSLLVDNWEPVNVGDDGWSFRASGYHFITPLNDK